MACLFQKVPFKALLLYIDDLLICSNTYPEHLKRLRFVLDRLTFGNLTLSPKKTKLFQQEVKFLGLRISKEGIAVDHDKVKAIKNLPPPTSVKQVQKFLGMVNYHRLFIRDFASISAPLYDITGKSITEFKWTKECQVSFDKLKSCLATAPILGIPSVNDEYSSYVLTLDASKKGLGAVLSQLDSRTKKRKVISYYSKKLPKHFQRWGATRLEFLALHSAIMNWRLYLQGTKFTVYTDCKSLQNLNTIFSKDNAYMQRRLSDLSGFQFTIHHVSGKSQEIQIPDYLSRYAYGISENTVGTQTVNSVRHMSIQDTDEEQSESCENYDVSNGNDQVNSNSENEGDMVSRFERVLRVSEPDCENESLDPVTTDDIIREYQNDMILSEVISWVSVGSKPEDIDPIRSNRETWYYYRKFELLKYSKGLLKYKVFNQESNDYNWVTVVPHTLIKRAIYMFHNLMGSCHPGVKNTVDQVSRRFHFYKIKQEIKLYVGACITCHQVKATNRPLKAPLKPQFCESFNACLQIDHLEPQKGRTPSGNVALLTMIDLYSSYIVCVPVRSTSADHTIKAILKHWISRFGVPDSISHDQGSGFESKLFKETCKVFGISNVRSTPWKSSTQGRVESSHRRINTCFRAIMGNKDFHKYDQYIDWIVFTLNCMRSNRTGFSPNFLVFGREARSPRDLLIPDPQNKEFKDYETEAYKVYLKVRDTVRKVSSQVEKQAKFMANSYDTNARGPYFEAGMQWYK
eukprot:sb/3462409/